MKVETNNSPQQTRSLVTDLAIAFFTLSAITLLISGGIALFTYILAYRNNISAQQQLIAQDASKSVSDFIQDKLNVMKTAVGLIDVPQVSSIEKQNILDGLLGLEPSFRGVVLLDTSDVINAEASRLVKTASNPILTRITQNVIDQIHAGESYISPVYIDDTTSEPLITIAIPVTNVLGEFQGTLAAEVNLKFMWDLVDQLKIGETGYVYVVDNQGNIVAYRDTARVLAGENVKDISEVKEFLKNPTTTSDVSPEVTSYAGLNKTNVLGTYVPLGTPPWAVVVELPTSEAYRPITQVTTGAVGTILLIALVAAVAGLVLARRVAAPLVDLTGTATSIANGNTQLQAKLSGAQEIVSLAAAFNSMTSQLHNLIGNLEQRVSERTAEVETARAISDRRSQELLSISEISRIISTEQRLHVLLSLITRLVSERFNFYHVGIFFIDDSRTYAYLQAANSEGGQRMLERGHRLEVGYTGIVGNVAYTGKTRIALDVGSDAVFFNNPDLPKTRSEMALPLISRGQIIGVLDVQSTQSGAFTESDTKTLSILADQVAIAIQNARLFEQTQQAREEAETLYNQYLKTDWSSFVKQEANVGYQQSTIGGQLIDKPVETEEILSVLENGDVVVVNGRNGNTQPALAVPVKLRGQTIGVLNVKAPTPTRKWTQDEINMAQAISDRLALALDNARLLQESQRNAAKEAKIGEVTAKIGASINLQSVLQTAVEELGKSLPGSEVVIQFQTGNKKE